MAVIRRNFLDGTTSVLLSAGGVTMTSAELAALPVVAAPDYAWLSLDPLEEHGLPEIVKVTAHSSGAVTATIVRGQQQTQGAGPPREHPSSTFWAHPTTALDLSDAESALAVEAADRATGDSTRPLNTQTNDYALVLADAGKVVEANKATPITVTVPSNASAAFPVGSIIEVNQVGVGLLTVAPAVGVTLNGTLTAPGRHGSLLLRKRATNEWTVTQVPASVAAFNVKAFGAVGDGVADDTAAIDAAMDAAVGGATVYFPPGTFLVSYYDIAGFPTYKAAVQVPGGVRVQGAGKDATFIKLAASQTGDGHSVMSNRDLDGGDAAVTVADLTIDGNGASQTILGHGLRFAKLRGARVRNVRVKNARGTASFPPGETFHFEAYACDGVTYESCEAIGDAGAQGTGFSADNSTHITYSQCIARGMSAGMGYTHWHCAHLTYSACVAHSNGSNGFNSELSNDVVYLGCHSGLEASDGADTFPHAAGANLGNTASGFTVNESTSVDLIGCHARNNGNNGADLINSSSGRIIGGWFTGSTNSGVYIDSPVTAVLWTIDPSVDLTGNTGNTINLNGGLGTLTITSSILAAPTLPATTDPLTNPYPWAVMVHLIGGTTSLVHIDGTNVGNGARFARVARGSTIAVTYSAAPTWVWVRS